MVRISIAAAAAALLAATTASGAIVHAQEPLQLKAVEQQNQQPIAAMPRKLHGRFLHITDIHPDSYYKRGGDPKNRCHRGSDGPAGHWGMEKSACDTPWNLVNETFRWIDENLKDQIDFVVWTGDSARHDGDVKIPRTSEEIYESNEKVTSLMVDIFGNSSDVENPMTIPIVPTLGNNDIFPHNIMQPGPSPLTKEYVELWKQFIPETQFHVFHKGAYHWQQVVPGKNGKTGPGSQGGLAVFSLNTLYFFDSNTAVDGCDIKSEPGYEQMEWLDVQLSLVRERGMKAILIGHVPPAWTSSKMSWDKSCWRKYVLWSRQYRDVIVGHLYGHMNLDHFMLLDSHRLKPPHLKPPTEGKKGQKPDVDASGLPAFNASSAELCTVQEFNPEGDPNLSLSSAESYLSSLREAFAGMVAPAQSDDSGVDNSKDKNPLGGKWAERYVLTHVGPSIVPNYFPTLRVMEYNISGLVDDQGVLVVESESKSELEPPVNAGRKKGKKKLRKPAPPAKTAPPGPAYSMQPYTFIGYTQYFLNLTKYNALAADKKGHPAGETPAHNELRKRDSDDEGVGRKGGKAKIKFEVEYDTRTDKVYKLQDLTVRSYVKLAQDIVDASNQSNEKKNKESEEPNDENDSGNDGISDDDDVVEGNAVEDEKKNKKRKGNKARDKVWHAFVKRAFVGTIARQDLEQYDVRRAECAAIGL